jgi:hypothetical protein
MIEAPMWTGLSFVIWSCEPRVEKSNLLRAIGNEVAVAETLFIVMLFFCHSINRRPGCDHWCH